MSESSGGNSQDWTQLYHAALLELDPTKLPERIKVAQQAVEARISLVIRQPNSQELRALEDALRNLRSLGRQFP